MPMVTVFSSNLAVNKTSDCLVFLYVHGLDYLDGAGGADGADGVASRAFRRYVAIGVIWVSFWARFVF